MSDHPRTDAAREIVAVLEAAGIRATADIRSVVPPCVYVEPNPRLVFNATLSGIAAATWRIVCLSPGPGTLPQSDTLDGLLEAVLDVLECDSAEPAPYQTGLSPEALPAILITYTTP